MQTFTTWLIHEGRQAYIEPAILKGYDHEFERQLRRLIAKTTNPALRAKLKEMLDCPVRDRSGGCRSFAEYVLAALLKNGIHQQYDIEDALSYVIQKMLLDRSETTGEPKANLFTGFLERPDDTPNFNALQARFFSFLQGAVNNIRKGKVPRLGRVERRPQGTLSIGPGRNKEGESGGYISPDEIADRPSAEAGLDELISDIESLLQKKEMAYPLPLLQLFQAIMGGQNTQQQRARFGDRQARVGRQVIVQTIQDYARSTGNNALLNLLNRLQGSDSTPQRKLISVKPVRPQLSDQERDYTSIISVIDRFDRPVGTADLGRYRRRWLEYPPRDTGSGFRNRLEEVVSKMVADGVLVATRTRQGALVYCPGRNYEQHRAVQV